MVERPSEHDDPARRVSEDQERARALAAVLREEAERDEAIREVEVRRAVRTRLRRGAMVIVWIAAAWIWLAGPVPRRLAPAPEPAPAAEADALRVYVFLQVQQVEAFRSRTGRLPFVLEDVGPPLPGMTYERRDSRSFEIRGESRRMRILYGSEHPPMRFLGNQGVQLESPAPVGTAPS